MLFDHQDARTFVSQAIEAVSVLRTDYVNRVDLAPLDVADRHLSDAAAALDTFHASTCHLVGADTSVNVPQALYRVSRGIRDLQQRYSDSQATSCGYSRMQPTRP